MKITHDDLSRALGRIEGKLHGFESLPQRVSNLERSQSWMKGGWAALVGMFAWLVRLSFGR